MPLLVNSAVTLRLRLVRWHWGFGRWWPDVLGGVQPGDIAARLLCRRGRHTCVQWLLTDNWVFNCAPDNGRPVFRKAKVHGAATTQQPDRSKPCTTKGDEFRCLVQGAGCGLLVGFRLLASRERLISRVVSFARCFRDDSESCCKEVANARIARSRSAFFVASCVFNASKSL